MIKRNHSFKNTNVFFNICLLLALLFSFTKINAQSEITEKFNKLSVEVAGGMHIPLAPNDFISTKDYIGFKQIKVSARYMFNKKYGLNAYFATNRFEGGEKGMFLKDQVEREIDLYNTFTRIGVEGVANMGYLLKLNPRFLEKTGLLGYAGAGLTFSSPSTERGTDRMGILTIGLRPQRKISERLAVFGEGSVVVNIRQHYSYSGIIFDKFDQQAKTGAFMNLQLGLVYYLGEHTRHADWY